VHVLLSKRRHAYEAAEGAITRKRWLRWKYLVWERTNSPVRRGSALPP